MANSKHIMKRILQSTLLLGLGLQLQSARADGPVWSDTLIAPVANPIFFETPAINSELRPIYMYHELNDNFAIPGNVQVYALQFRWQLTDRLALIATKDGFVDINPDAGASVDGWADIGAGLKYALIKNEEHKFILTPGVKFEVPTGDDEVFQGNGDGEFDLFASAAKGLGDVQVMGSLGLRLPIDADEETSQLHYSLQVAYPLCQWFKPFVVLNGYTVLSDADGPALGSEGYDLINFGTSNASGETQIVLGAGFRAALCECLDLGAAYEQGVDHSDGIFDQRITADLIWKF
jgi:hypothetical protein